MDGDSFTLLMDKYEYTVRIEAQSKPKAKKAAKPKAAKKEAQTVNLTGGKKHASSEEEDALPNEYDLEDDFIDNSEHVEQKMLSDEENIELLKSEAKRFMHSGKRKTYGSSDEEFSKPVCKYGANCYRTNPDHLAQYYHPKSKNKKVKVEESSSQHSPMDDEHESKSNSAVDELQEAFKAIDRSVIEAILEGTI